MQKKEIAYQPKGKKQKKILRWIRNHKLVTVVSCLAVVVLLLGGTSVGIQVKKYFNSQKALELAATGEVSQEDLELLEADGGFVEFGSEIVDPTTGETVVLTQDENGIIVRTVTRDSQGNNTGVTIPEDHSQEYYGGGDNPNPVPQPKPTHSHSWIAHQATREVPHTQEIYHPAITHQISYYVCNLCGQRCNGTCFCNGHANSSHGVYETVIDQAAWTETLTTYSTESYIDYYYCSDCGVRQ